MNFSDVLVSFSLIPSFALLYLVVVKKASAAPHGIWRWPFAIFIVLMLVCWAGQRLFGLLPTWPMHAASACFWAVMAANCYQNFRAGRFLNQDHLS